MPGHNWTLKKVQAWVAQVCGRTISRGALRCFLRRNGLRWKKCQKLLGKANPEKRAAFMQEFLALFAQLACGQVRLVYIDESHFHREMDLGYTWALVGERAWRLSDCPRLADRINWYGAYDFSNGQCFLWNEGACNGANTVKFLQHLHRWLGESTIPVVIIWDGAPCHRDKQVQTAAAHIGFTLMPLPGYSPDLNPIEALWKWMRQEVTQNHCYPSLRSLFLACKAFIDRINLDPLQMIARLWPRFELDPHVEKLLLSS